MAIALFSYATKWESLTSKIRKRRKLKFVRIDSWVYLCRKFLKKVTCLIDIFQPGIRILVMNMFVELLEIDLASMVSVCISSFTQTIKFIIQSSVFQQEGCDPPTGRRHLLLGRQNLWCRSMIIKFWSQKVYSLFFVSPINEVENHCCRENSPKVGLQILGFCTVRICRNYVGLKMNGSFYTKLCATRHLHLSLNGWPLFTSTC
jgi:hypothetical protein